MKWSQIRLSGLLVVLLSSQLQVDWPAQARAQTPGLSWDHVSAKLDAVSRVAAPAVVVEPDAGVRPILRAIDGAQRSIFLEAYILTDRRIVRALERAATQGVEVFVVLERHPFGMGPQPQRVADVLRAAGVAVRWAGSQFLLTHAKFAVLDDREAVVGTANFSAAAFLRNREFLVLDRDPLDVRQLSNIFRCDWDRLTPVLGDPGLVVSPVNGRTGIATLLGSARVAIDIYAEEVRDPGIEMLLLRLAHRGVRIRIMTPPGGIAGPILRFRSIAKRYPRTPYIHAKAIVVDGRRAFVGSENLSSQSLDRNREVGLLLRGSISRLVERTFRIDWVRAGASRP